MMRGVRRDGGPEIGPYNLITPVLERRMGMDGLAALPAGCPMTGLLEVDVTDVSARLRRIRRRGGNATLFALVVASTGQLLKRCPEFNAVLAGSRIVEFDEVDISVPVELGSGDGRAPRQLLLRNADRLSADEVQERIRAAALEWRATGAAGEADRRARRMMRLLSLVQRGLRLALIRRLAADPLSIKRRAGTVLVTSVGSFGKLPGFVVPYAPGNRALLVAVGSAADKPALVNGEILPRKILSLSLTFNHLLIDGAPAARFASRLCRMIEKGDLLDDRNRPPGAPASRAGADAAGVSAGFGLQ